MPVTDFAFGKVSTSEVCYIASACRQARLVRHGLLRLEALVEELASNEAVHPSFRLWLSSMPSPAFPPTVLQAGLKLAVQPPRGIRATLSRCAGAHT